jgi:hypothetical protein
MREEEYALMTGVDGTSAFASDMLLSRVALTAVVHQNRQYLTIKPLWSFPRFTSASTPSTQGNRSCGKGKAVLTFLPSLHLGASAADLTVLAPSIAVPIVPEEFEISYCARETTS